MIRTKLTDRYGIELPFVSAGMAFIALPPLAAAVSNAGGLGQLAAGAAPPEISIWPDVPVVPLAVIELVRVAALIVALENVAEENIQARVRGNFLMAISNKFGSMVLSTGNKSEMAVGYCTLYGDMAGGLAMLSDVPKTMVYELANLINRERELIPRASVEKPPSAELRPNQTDQDSLPPYEVLDRILRAYIEDVKSPEEIADQCGFDIDLVRSIAGKVDRNEYKRRQAPPGLKITSRAFGLGRPFPIVQNFNA